MHLQDGGDGGVYSLMCGDESRLAWYILLYIRVERLPLVWIVAIP
jgi:hypothetical protein